jgi:quercetin dioxygenase-like cupin family protein
MKGLEISYLESGRLVFDLDSNKHMLQPGDLTIARP